MIFKHKKRLCFFSYLLIKKLTNELKETMEFCFKIKSIFKYKKRPCFFSYLLNKEFTNDQKELIKFYFRIMFYVSPWLRTFHVTRIFFHRPVFSASPYMLTQTCTALIEISRTLKGPQCTRPYIIKAFKSGFNTLHSTKPYNTITVSSSETEYQVTTSKFIINNFNVYF